MNNPADALRDAANAVWQSCAAAESVGEFSRDELVAAQAAAAALRRHVDALQAQLAAGIARESRRELGAQSLAKEQGFRNETQFIAASAGISAGEARRLVSVGEAIVPRPVLGGAPAPAKWPAVQRAVTAGALSTHLAGLIVAFLNKAPLRLSKDAEGKEKLARAEAHLVEQAVGMTAEQLSALITRAEAWLDPSGAGMRDEEARAARFLNVYERGGMVHVNGQLDPESAAPLVAALDGYVSEQFRARKDAVATAAPDADRRTVGMMRADALSLFADHMLGCGNSQVPLGGARIVVRLDAEDLMSGTGTAEIDGIAQPVSVAAARRLAAAGNVLPWVCGGSSGVLDFGRSRRLFTKIQKLLLVERDGGCAMCNLPPGMTHVHHRDWWERDTGKTDLEDGVLLCVSCHHRVHENGWDIQIEGTGLEAKVWFLPLPHVDPARERILGGRARFGVPRELMRA